VKISVDLGECWDAECKWTALIADPYMLAQSSPFGYKRSISWQWSLPPPLQGVKLPEGFSADNSYRDCCHQQELSLHAATFQWGWLRNMQPGALIMKAKEKVVYDRVFILPFL
jgi:hypothetical protein